MAELVVMTDRQFQFLIDCQAHKLLRLLCTQSKWLFDIGMNSGFKALARDLKVALRRGCDVHNIRPRLRQQPLQVGKS